MVKNCVILLVSVLPAIAQPPPVSVAGGIFGRVFSADTHAPVRRASVKIYTSKDQWDEITDAEGRFWFPAIVKGEYTLIAHRDGFTDRSYTVERSDFDAQLELSIELRPQGLIVGKIVDGVGQPLEGAAVEALGARTRGAAIQVLNSANTNDLGEYRLAGLDPGTYWLRATYRQGRRDDFDPTPLAIATAYYGGSEKPAEIAVKSGSVTAEIDFTLSPASPAVLRGALHTEAGPLSETANLWLMGQAGEGGHNGTAREGRFEIPDVGSGTYWVSAENSSKTLFGVVTVQVDGTDINDLDIVLRPVPDGISAVVGG